MNYNFFLLIFLLKMMKFKLINLKDLRIKWKEMMVRKNPDLKNKSFSLPCVTQALTHGLSVAGYLFIDPGDELILPNYYWGNYNLIFKNACEAEFKTFNLFRQGCFDLRSFNETLNEGPIGKRIILLNFPNNPTGFTPHETEVGDIINIIKKSAEQGNEIVVIVDDAYFGLIYEKGIAKQSIFTKLLNLHENILAVKIDGATKEDYVWGLRVGFISFGNKAANEVVYKALEAKASGTVRGSISNASHLSQSLLYKAYVSHNYQKQKEEKYELLHERYLKVKEILHSHSEYQQYFRPLPFNSGYFMCIQLLNALDGEKVRQVLLDKYSTGLIHLNGLLRIAFSAVAIEKIDRLFNNVYKACKEVSK